MTLSGDDQKSVAPLSVPAGRRDIGWDLKLASIDMIYTHILLSQPLWNLSVGLHVKHRK